jgi:hypothetical protein
MFKLRSLWCYPILLKTLFFILLQKFDTERRAKFCTLRFFSFFWRKIPQIPKSGITHMVTSNGGHPLHHPLRHSGRMSYSFFNRRTTMFQTFTQWPQASALYCSSPPSGLLGHLFPPQWTEYSHI